MDSKLVFVRTPKGDQAVRQNSRRLQRESRLLLAQLDGKLTVGELAKQLGDRKKLEEILGNLLRQGLLAPLSEAEQLWAQSSVLPLSPDTVVDALDDARDLFGAPVFVRDPVQLQAPVVERGRFASYLRTRLPRVRHVFVLFLLAALLGLAFFPYDNWRARIEAGLGRSLRQPVTINKVYLQFYPTPQLAFDGVQIGGKTGGASIETARMGWRFSWLWAGFRMPEQIELQGVVAHADTLATMAGGVTPVLQRALRRIDVRNGTVLLGERRVEGLDGQVSFAADGRFELASLRRSDQALRIKATRAVQGAQVEVEAFGWQADADFPLLTTLQAKGVLQAGKLIFEQFDAGLLGGVIKGHCVFGWGREDRWSGEAAMARLDAAQVAATFAPVWRVAGAMDGQLRFNLRSSAERPFPGEFDVQLDSEIGRGSFAGLDIAEATRHGRGKVLSGGETRFDHLAANIRLAPAFVDISNLRLQAGVLSADGALAMLDGRVDGRLAVKIRSSVYSRHSRMQLGGSPASMVATVTASY